MKDQDILKAWRDGEFLDSLSDEQRQALPASPADLPQIDDDALTSVTGGCGGFPTSGFCTPCPPIHCY
jgi:mersacidin/lichenicidin family type 2 lantibiotic